MYPWEKYQPANNNNISGPWDKYKDTAPEMGSALPRPEQFKKAFTSGDPLAGFSDMERARLSPILDTYDKPEQEAKKHVLSQFLASRVMMPPETVHQNFDAAAKIYTNGKAVTVDALWNTVTKQFQPSLTKRLAGAVAGLGEAADNTGAALQRGAGKTVEAIEGGVYGTSGAVNQLPALFDAVSDTLRHAGVKKKLPGRDYFDENSDVYFKAAQYQRERWSNGKGIAQTFSEEGTAAGAEQLFYGVMENVPQLALQAAMTAVGFPVMGAAWMGSTSGAQQFYEIKDDPNMTQEAKMLNVGLYAAAEYLGEYYFTNPLIKGMFKGAEKEAVKTGLLAAAKKIIGGSVQEGFGEGLTQFAQNATDLITGKDDINTLKMSRQEIQAYLLNGVTDAALLGAVPGAGFGMMGHLQNVKSYADVDAQAANIREELRQANELRKTELLAKPEITDDEVIELNDLQGFEEVAFPKPVVNELMDALGVDEETANSIIALRKLREMDNPGRITAGENNSYSELERVLQNFQGAPYKIVATERELPADVQSYAMDMDYSGRIRGAVDADGSIWFVGNNIAPAQAEKVAFHEIAGHYGIKGVLGEAYKQTMLDIFNSRKNDVTAAMERAGYRFDYTTDSGRIAAADEFLAFTAEQAEKPSWFKEIIRNIKQALRKYFPNLRFTDNEIAGLLSKSRKYAENNKNRIVIMLNWENQSRQWVLSAYGRELENKKGSESTVRPITVDDSSVTAPYKLQQSEAASNKDNIQPDSDNVKFSLAGDIESDNFKNWFGDWQNDPANASKVVDEDGKPLVVYHGTGENFTVFNKNNIGDNFNADDIGFFFTDNKKTAQSYADNTSYGTKKEKKGIVLSTYLSLKNPYIENIDFDPISEWDNNNKKIIEKAKKQKADGIVIKSAKGESLYIAFESNQVKSATDNNGQYSRTNDDIRFSLAESDADYLDAVNSGDVEAQQKMVRDAAQASGYNEAGFHQTSKAAMQAIMSGEGFRLDKGRARLSDEQVPDGFFFKPYNNDIGVVSAEDSVQIPVYLEMKNPLKLSNRHALESILLFLPEYNRMQSELSGIDNSENKIFAEMDRKLSEIARTGRDEEYRALLDEMDNQVSNWQVKIRNVASEMRKVVTAWLKSEGHDSLLIYEDKGSFGRSTTTYVVLKPEQIKSAEPITRDESGNVIPLSQRFNHETNDIRFSLSAPSSYESWLDEKEAQLKEDLDWYSKQTRPGYKKWGNKEEYNFEQTIPADIYGQNGRLSLLRKIRQGADLDKLEAYHQEQLQLTRKLKGDPYDDASFIKLIQQARKAKSMSDDNIRFSLSNDFSEETKKLYAQAVAPGVRKGQIVNPDTLREIFPHLTEGQALDVLTEARSINEQHNHKGRENKFQTWKKDNYPWLVTLEEKWANGVKPDAKFGNAETIEGSYIDWSKGEASDIVAQSLDMEEQELIDRLNGLRKADIRKQYTKLTADDNKRAKRDELLFRQEEIEQMKSAILAGKMRPYAETVRQYPELGTFLEALLTGNLNFEIDDAAAANVAAMSDPNASSVEMARRYKLLREIQYQKETADNPDKTAAAKKYIYDYTKKFMPEDKQGKVLKYLMMEKITAGNLQKALQEIDKWWMEGSEVAKLKADLKSLQAGYTKLHKQYIDNRVSLDDKMFDIREFAQRNLPEDVRKGELNKIFTRMDQLVSASDEKKPFRRVPLLDEYGNQLTDEYGKPAWKTKLNADGSVKRKKNGEVAYEYAFDESVQSQREKLVSSAFNIISRAARRSESDKLRGQIEDMFKRVEVKKDTKGRPVGALTPEVQIKVDKLRIMSGLDAATAADAIEALGERVMNEPENDDLIEELADLKTFTNLKAKSLEEIRETHDNLAALIKDGKTLYKAALVRERAVRDLERIGAINEVTGFKGLLPDEAARLRMEDFKGIIEGLKTYHRKHLSFEWLLNNISRKNTKSGTLQGELFKDLSQMVHVATHTESTATRKLHQQFTAALPEIFGAEGKALERKLADFALLQEKTGVFRMVGAKVETFSIPIKEFREAASRAVDPAIRAKNAELIRRAELNNERVIRQQFVKKGGVPTEIPMSKDEALNYWLLMKQPDKLDNMNVHGWTEESMRQLEAFIGKDGLRLGEWLQEYYRTDYYAINEVFKQQFHINMPQIENYSPASYDVTTGKNDSAMLDAPAGMSGLNPGSLISRKQHSFKPKQVAATCVFFGHTAQMEHYKAWAATMKRLRGIFNGLEVRDAIRQNYGKTAYSIINEKINHFADGGNRKAESIAVLDAVRSGFTKVKLSYNVGVFVKQLTSLPAYGFDIPMSSFIKNEAAFWAHPAENFKTLLNGSDFIRNRWGEGYDRDMMKVLREGKDKTGTLNKFIEFGMSFGKAGDMLPVVVGGWAVYKYHYDKLITAGVNPQKAHKSAILEFEMSTERSQQAGHIKDLGLYQSGGSIARLFTMFTTSPRQYYASMSESVFDAFAGKPGAKAEAAKKMFIGQVVLTFSFQLATDLMSKGFDWEEYDWRDYLKAMLIGPLEGLFIAGKFIPEFADALFTGDSRYTEGSAAFSDNVKIVRGLAKLNKTMESGEYEFDDILKSAEYLAEGVSAVSAPAGIYSIASREYRRFKNLIFGKEEK